ncbi:MAG: hypothetical protein ACXVCE_11450, partial [Bacteriovorax sp.]
MNKWFAIVICCSLFCVSTNAKSLSDALDSSDISAGVNHICALTNMGVKCFGNSESVTLNPPLQIENPSNIAAGNRFSCLIEKKGIRCWGEIPGQNKTEILIGPSLLKNPRLLSVGYEHACAVSEKDVIKCWGKNDFGEGVPPKQLKNISEISLGMSNSCVIANKKVICWGMKFADSLNVPENLVNPRNLT